MGEAKRRQRLDPNFGLVRRNLSFMNVFGYSEVDDLEAEKLGLPKRNEGLNCYFNQEAIKTLVELAEKKELSFEEAEKVVFKDQSEQFLTSKYFLALEKSQGLSLPWLELGYIVSLLDHLTVQVAINLWDSYSVSAAAALGQVRLSDPRLVPWFRRLRGASLFALERLLSSLPKSSALQFSAAISAKKEFYSLWDTTLELALAFANNNVIYAGQALTVWKGGDGLKGRGELMIAVKHSSGCWNHYPFSENLSVSLSDYKQAKLALKKFPLSLQGELYHQRSNKLARLLGLTVKNNYAYLVK